MNRAVRLSSIQVYPFDLTASPFSPSLLFFFLTPPFLQLSSLPFRYPRLCPPRFFSAVYLIFPFSPYLTWGVFPYLYLRSCRHPCFFFSLFLWAGEVPSARLPTNSFLFLIFSCLSSSWLLSDSILELLRILLSHCALPFRVLVRTTQCDPVPPSEFFLISAPFPLKYRKRVFHFRFLLMVLETPQKFLFLFSSSCLLTCLPFFALCYD